MKYVLKHLKPYTYLIIFAVLCTICRVFSELSLPNLMSKIVDEGILSGDMMLIYKTGAFMLLIALLSALASVFSNFFGAKIGASLSRDLRKSVYTNVQSFSNTEFDKFGSASLITRTINDITQLQHFIVMFIRMIIMAPMMLSGSIIMAFSKNTTLALIFLALIIPLLLIIILISKYTVPLSVTMQKKIDKINLVIREKLTGMRVIRAFTMDEHEEKRFDDANKSLTDTAIKLQLISSALMPSLSLVLNSAIILIVWLGAKNIAAQNLMVGDLMAVLQYVTHIMMSLMVMSMIFISLPRASASAKRLAEILDTESSIKDKENASDYIPDSLIEFKDVSFKYPASGDYVLNNISFTAEPGKTTAIIGSTGSGKSTVISLIPRLYDVTEGQVLIGGMDVRTLSQEALRAKIGFVPQKATLFSGTIEENIKYANPELSDESAQTAAEISQSASFIKRKDGGMKSLVSQGAQNLSGGQKQRLSIARAIAKNPDIFIFDDSFSALDFKTDAALRKALLKTTQNKTVIIVAQRVSTIMNADKIIVLNEGCIVGDGTHKELYENCEVYREIVLSQLSKEEAI
ncbi:MAG: ABC transporter ATP-binding protein [Ruminococcaceae bacterium]|nr:ABC transporter ATP-binding protein [Oscillospiraceae bacterium]